MFGSTTPLLSRRSVLMGAGGSLAAAALAGCGTSAPPAGSKGDPAIVLIAPGDVPPGWDRVLAKVNAKLTAETGLSLKVIWIGWSNYLQAELLKWTSGEKFTGALEADWAHLPKLAGDGALIGLDDVWKNAATDYPNLARSIHPRTIDTSRIKGKLWGIPQVSNATSLLGFMTRKDLGDKEISTFADFERYLRLVKQKQPSMVPYGMDNGYVNSSLVLFNEASWEPAPEYLSVPTSNLPILFIKTADAIAGTARVVPIWEVPSMVETIGRVRTWYSDGLLNKDLLNVDKKTVYSLFGQGKFAAAIGVTDGQMTTTYGATTKKVSGAALDLVLPYADPSKKVYTSFGASNHVVFNVRGEQLTEGMKFLEWLSIQENHDLLEYGEPGADWDAQGDKEYVAKSDYVFPGYTMSWRIPLERRPTSMIASEKKWLEYVRNFDNFELSPLAGYSLDQTPLKTVLAQFSAATPKVLRPLQAGSVDSAPGIEALKKEYAAAGVDKLITETEKQLGAFFAAR